MSKKQEILIFADGACSGNPGPGGWGAIVVRKRDAASSTIVQELGGFENETTNNRMEITAVGQALRSIENEEGDVIIYTDSSYVIQGLRAWIFGWKKNGWKKADGEPVANEAYWKRLDELFYARKKNGKGATQLMYVPGHAGVAGNERCDEIAVDYSKGVSPHLFTGSEVEYLSRMGVDLSVGMDKALTDPPTRSSSSANGNGEPKKVFYLSLVNGAVERHATWSECEAKVKGRPGVKFKKVSSETEAEEVLRGWGVKN